jgi:hypothetical protein
MSLSPPGHSRPAAPLRTTGDGCLFVLGEEGVFLSVPRQELYVFNTSATFVWCCIEAGMSEEDIVGRYAENLGVGAATARADVARVLDQWWGAGFIGRPALLPETPLPFATALARLLVDPRLRAAFAEDPFATARDLRVGAADRDTFAALDASQLEAQAKRLRERHSRRKQPTPWTDTLLTTAVDGARTPLDLALDARVRRIGTPVVERRYRMLTTDFRIRFASTAQADCVHPALAHLEVDAPASDAVIHDVVETDAGHVVLDDLVPRAYCRDLRQLTPVMKQLVAHTARNRYRCFLEIHAGVVSNGEACILLPGASGSGKSTLTLGLVLAGLEYFSDEIALLDEGTLDVRPFPLGLGIKPGALHALESLCPEAAALDVHLREDGKHVRYLAPPADRRVPADTTRPARWLVFPCYQADVATELRPIARSEALRRLLQECTMLPRLLDETRVENLVRWMRRLECFELPMSSLDDAVALVMRLCMPSPVRVAPSV